MANDDVVICHCYSKISRRDCAFHVCTGVLCLLLEPKSIDIQAAEISVPQNQIHIINGVQHVSLYLTRGKISVSSISTCKAKYLKELKMHGYVCERINMIWSLMNSLTKTRLSIVTNYTDANSIIGRA